MTETSPIAQAIRHGWPLIKLSAPTDKGPMPGKKPVNANWETAPGLSAEDAETWLANGGNIGVRCGDGLLVVDCDGDRPDGLPETPAVQTGGGGMHLYYRVPPGTTMRVGNTVRHIHPTTDTRGAKGQVVYPPSIHAKTGALYEWLPGMSPDDIPIADLPQWVIEAINDATPPPWKQKATAPTGPAPVVRFSPDLHPFIQGNIRKAIENVLNAPAQEGNNTLNVEAYGLGGWHELSEDAIMNWLLPAATSGGRRTEAEARATILSGVRGGREKPRTVPVSKAVTAAVQEIAAGPVPASAISDILTALPPTAPFKVLGYNLGKYYFMSTASGQIVELTPTAMAQEPNLYRLAPRQWWRCNYQDDGKVSAKDAADALIVNAHGKGLFDKSCVRGRGAWHDEGRIVLHRGTSLLVDGAKADLTTFDSENVYQRGHHMNIPYKNPLTADEAQSGILALCNMLCWEKSIFGNLLAGWLALAPICGVLNWRPHIWITGQSGTGKSYIQDEIIPILGPMVHFVQGSSTEAGVRQMLGSDALAVSFDESEPDGFKAATRISHILELARQASSSKGGVIAKGTATGEAMQFDIRSMFCMSSVAVGLARRSDQSRFTVLSMVQPPQGAEGLAAFTEIAILAMRVCSGTMAERFVARSCHMAPVILESARVFTETFAATKTNRRNADQIGALLAGYWSLRSDEAATHEDARYIVNDIDLDGVTPEADSNDEAQFLSYLMAKRIRCEVRDSQGHATTVERSIAELVETAAFRYDSGEDMTLQRHGMRCLEEGLFIANQHPGLADLLNDTQWGADWKRFAGRVPGAVGKSARLCGIPHRGQIINYTCLFGERDSAA